MILSKRIASLVTCLILSTAVMSGCTGGDAAGSTDGNSGNNAGKDTGGKEADKGNGNGGGGGGAKEADKGNDGGDKSVAAPEILLVTHGNFIKDLGTELQTELKGKATVKEVPSSVPFDINAVQGQRLVFFAVNAKEVTGKNGYPKLSELEDLKVIQSAGIEVIVLAIHWNATVDPLRDPNYKIVNLANKIAMANPKPADLKTYPRPTELAYLLELLEETFHPEREKAELAVPQATPEISMVRVNGFSSRKSAPGIQKALEGKFRVIERDLDSPSDLEKLRNQYVLVAMIISSRLKIEMDTIEPQLERIRSVGGTPIILSFKKDSIPKSEYEAMPIINLAPRVFMDAPHLTRLEVITQGEDGEKNRLELQKLSGLINQAIAENPSAYRKAD